MSKKIVDAVEVIARVRAMGDTFAVVANPPYVHPPFEIYPLAPARRVLTDGLKAVVMDMDGTTTTTEPLCVHALDTMVRRCSGRDADPRWPGLSPEADYPHIIGNSTTKHVEFLVLKYRDQFAPRAVLDAYLRGTRWTLASGRDPQRRRDALATLQACALTGASEYMPGSTGETIPDLSDEALERLYRDNTSQWQKCLQDPSLLTRIGVEIYYHRYHEVLESIGRGENTGTTHTIAGVSGRLVQPMPGIGIFLALVKGILGEHAGACARILRPGAGEREQHALADLGRYFQTHPVLTGLVTSSIRYEADIVLGEIFRQLVEEVTTWPVPEPIRQTAREAFRDHHCFYDTVVTATDSHEIRLKPHRDLYSIALFQLGLAPEDFGKVAGFEDSESGTIAMRAAGIGLACAVPFHMTEGHSFEAAAWVCPGGLPEVLLDHHLFLPPQ
ncbi:MAG TPA: hypothetical protein PK379_07945 [Candidatus Hydrogenedentes bacterium]|nr:hypothetical protein [Candidatus Hydrogenedentota bacterium]HOK89945.1 hypothetical protein [Candidatus Hydrogenedentota bacterium]